ncbi:GNAT family N-acetyltransferase [Aquabacterium humicola]|uniref:GNAT family N-acetyltransferase n=1 Tax=Aquabacterium humicola TaxID=3237377 RepID=UPI00254325E3|nr:GNAT family N-acetyltransferase [Rubrivivax pictus]
MNDDTLIAPSTPRYEIRRLPRSDWSALAPFIHRHNRVDGGVRCLHAEQGDTVGQHAQELADLAAGPQDEAAFWAVHEAASGAAGEAAGEVAGEVAAMIGCVMDPALRRAWLRGPLLAQAGDPALARRLVERLQAELAPAIHCFDAFPAEADEPLNQLYREAGFRPMGVYRVMQADLAEGPPAHGAAGGALARAATVADLPPLLALHHALFRSSYLKDSDFEAALAAEDRRMLVAVVDGRIAGYLHAKDDPAEDEVYVDYLGVDEGLRGRGLGGALLREAIAWGRGLGRRKASLTVREDRPVALRLYERAGFRQLRAGMHWRSGAD